MVGIGTQKMRLGLTIADPVFLVSLEYALRRNRGRVLSTARELGVPHRTFLRFMREFPRLAEMVREARWKK